MTIFRPPHVRLIARVLVATLATQLAAALSAATISGVVRATGPEAPTGAAASDDGYGSRRYKFIERLDYRELTDFVVWIEQTVPESELPQPRPVARIVQRDGTFQPHVLPIVVGTTVEWPNEDTIFHNVFSVSESTPFDLGLYKSGDTARRVTFEKVGRVDVFCSIHTRMNCIVLVLPNTWFAKADARGRYSITDVPAGRYQLKAWHERLPARTATVDVPAQGEITVDFVLGFGDAAAP